MKNDYQSEVDKEILNRIEEMESPDYEFPKRFSKGDYILVAAVAAICLFAVIAGAFI